MKWEWLPGLGFLGTLPAIALLYMLKRTYIDTPIASHLLWSRVMREWESNRPWQRLRSRLLLLLQLLAAALLTAALIGPYVWTTPTGKKHIVLVLDESASMLTRTGETDSGAAVPSAVPAGTRLAAAARQLEAELASDSPKATYTLLALREQPEVVVSRASATTVKESLQRVTPAFGRAAYRETMSLASALLQGTTDGEIRVYSDDLWPEQVRDLPMAAPAMLRTTVIAPVSSELSLESFGVSPASGATGEYSGVASVRNRGTQPVTAQLSFKSGNGQADIRTETFQPGQLRTVYINSLPDTPYYEAKLAVNDAYEADNRMYAFPSSDRRKTVLLASSGNLFLEKALGRAGYDVIKIQQAQDGSFMPPSVSPDLIVIDAVSSSGLASPEWKRLLAEKPVWWIDAALEGTEAQPDMAKIELKNHPITQYIRLQDTHIAKAVVPAASLPVDTIVSAGQTPLIAAGESEGRRAVWFTFDLHQTDLPLRFEFPVLVQQIADWLTAETAGALGRLAAGSQKELVPSTGAEKAVWVRVSDADSLNPSQAPAQAIVQDGLPAAVQPVPAVPGLYRYDELDKNGQTIRSRYAEVYADKSEAVGAPGNKPELQQPGGAAVDLPASSAHNDKAGQVPYRLAGWIIVAVMALMLVEWEVYRRGYSR